jgi:acyl transferase domain-containing protein
VDPPKKPVPRQAEPIAIVAMGHIEPSSWRGPDTAVFTSGTAAALSQAIQAVSSGECTTAVAGMLVLESLPVAKANAHPVLAVLRVSAESTVDAKAVVEAIMVSRGREVTLPGLTIEAAPPVESPTTPQVLPWLLSAATEQELREEAAWLFRTVADLDAASVGATLLTRPPLPYRAAVVGTNRAELLAGLKALASGTESSTVVTGKARRGVAFLFTGQGTQHAGMGAELAATFPTFKEAYEEACTALNPHLPRPLNEVLNTEAVHETEFAQPALFALEVALYRLLESWGARPDYVAGHSIGELTAAHVAGVWTLADAAHLVAARARLMQALPRGGAMVAVEATEAEVAPLLSDTVSIAAINGPTSLVLSGESAATLAAAEELADRGRKTQPLPVSHAFHSPLMSPILPKLEAIAATVPHHGPTIPLISTVTGEEAELGPRYWAEQARSPVRFAEAVRTLTARGVQTFMELGPDASLTPMIQDCSPTVAVIPTLRTKHPETRTITEAFAHLFTTGSTVDGQSFSPQPPPIPLPKPPQLRRSA